jgi:hypothetical protein
LKGIREKEGEINITKAYIANDEISGEFSAGVTLVYHKTVNQV